jgi:hypothetical protein
VLDSFEQNYIRQLSDEYLVPIIVPNRLGIKLCAVGATDTTRQIIERFLMLIDELSLGESSAHFSSSSKECPSGATALIQFSNETPEKDHASLLDGSNNIFGYDMAFPNYPRWTIWEGAKTAFLLNGDVGLYSITVVRTSVPDDVLRAFTIKAMFQISTTSQPVEWAGPFFSIAQIYEPIISSSLVYEDNDPETSIRHYSEYNAVGLCRSDVMNIAFLFHDMSVGATPSQAQRELSEKESEIDLRLADLKIFERYTDIIDSRCIR